MKKRATERPSLVDGDEPIGRKVRNAEYQASVVARILNGDTLSTQTGALFRLSGPRNPLLMQSAVFINSGCEYPVSSSSFFGKRFNSLSFSNIFSLMKIAISSRRALLYRC
jgi:hypothetical protein